MLSNEVGPRHIGGLFDARTTGTILGVQRDDNNGWTLVQVDIGDTGGSIVEMRFVDTDPVEVEATVVDPPLNPPQEPERNPDGSVKVDEDGNPVFPPLDEDEIEPTPEAGE